MFCLRSYEQTPSNDPHWQLLWEDDFNTFDDNKWLKIDWAEHGEPQIYLAQNVTVSSGNLVIKVNNNVTYCPINPPTVSGAAWQCVNKLYYYTSGWVETKQLYNTQYGYIESRINLPYGFGFWPAFWTFIGGGVSGSNAAEIDIFEMFGSNPSTEFTTNIHRAYPPPPDYFAKGLMTSYVGYHTYGVEWSPSRIIWYIDNYPVRILPYHGIIDPVRIILNLAIDPNHLPNSSTPFPSSMYIDYVKVYELKKDCDSFINASNYNFSTYDNKVKNFIKIGGGNNSVPVGVNTFLRASQFVEFTDNLYVPLGASLYADANIECTVETNLKCSGIFNPCTFNFANYDNSIKKRILLGNNGCAVNITSINNNILLEAVEQITLKPDVTITPVSGKSVELKISACH